MRPKIICTDIRDSINATFAGGTAVRQVYCREYGWLDLDRDGKRVSYCGEWCSDWELRA